METIGITKSAVNVVVEAYINGNTDAYFTSSMHFMYYLRCKNVVKYVNLGIMFLPIPKFEKPGGSLETCIFVQRGSILCEILFFVCFVNKLLMVINIFSESSTLHVLWVILC